MNNNAPFEGTFGSNFSFEKTYFQFRVYNRISCEGTLLIFLLKKFTFILAMAYELNIVLSKQAFLLYVFLVGTL